MKKRLVVIGGGAAGFFCAVNAAAMGAPDLEVMIVEKASKLLSKVRISGGGRCNVTHNLTDITEMSKCYPRGQHFVRKALHGFSVTDTIEWFENRGVALKAEGDGRMFPTTDSSESVINALIADANRNGVQIQLQAEVLGIRTANEGFELEVRGRPTLQANYVCIACGGYPKSSMFEWLLATGHSIEPPVPSLFTFNLPSHPITSLMGVSVEHARVKIQGQKLMEEGPLLITHWGLSGPAVLKTSAWGARELAKTDYHFQAHINWVSGMKEEDWKNLFSEWKHSQPARQMTNLPAPAIPQRLWNFLLSASGIPEKARTIDLTSKSLNGLIRNLTDYTVEVRGKTTFKEEFVTAGGVRLAEVEPSTMQSRKLKGLYFAGEILDVDGVTGGFNFQHAWTSGYLAARAIAAQAEADAG